MSSIAAHRERYARLIVRSAGPSSRRLIEAFASIPREQFLGPAPWPVLNGSGHGPRWTEDPRELYQDVLVGIALERGINNGQPSLHGSCLEACAPAHGDTALHIGAGTGYYTAILAALVGPTGTVLAYEIEPDLAERARENLVRWPNVRVIAASACAGALPAADVIYVNAGATHPVPCWLDALKPGGRLIFPLTPNEGYGGMLLVTRRGETRYDAAMLMRVAFIPCAGARDEASARALAAALDSQPMHIVRSLRREGPPDDTAWYVGAGGWLSTADAG
ncbi:protein-L-isoaspartate O-methyltransferase family protein [Aquabacterium sp.]|uniref:protein-L-isoaspartate O-methyltransferase family protein n=1 Tax=Aquabacterium sp. TaxID=1872578 RepID=UPI002C1A7652|nr:methyltransferase domain-containing protein [Aquabacterium sp.]HSW04355.1 methyltransferase domain-containing protein [Aquabacterium sp.]